MGKSRKVSSISKEFDGKEVQGKRIERSGLFGSNVSKEVFKMPGGGKHIEKTRTNKKGDVVSRMSKDTKVNPLVFFNKNKEQAYKKAGGAMTAFKKSLKKAQDGLPFKNTYEGPLTESDTKRLDQAFPSTSDSNIQAPNLQSKPNMGYGSEDMRREKEKNDRGAFENYLKSPAVGANNKRLGTGLNSEPLMNQKYNREAQISDMNKMNNIDWNSEEGANTKRLLDRDYKEAFKKGGSAKRKK